MGALALQRFDPSRWELIVADDAAREATRSQVESWRKKARFTLRYVAVTGSHGPAAARNRGWKHAAGKIIAFTDDDTLPQPGWLQNGAKRFADPQVLAVAGYTMLPVSTDPTDYERDAALLSKSEFITANCFVRLEALERCGGFDERFKMAWREDSDLHFALLLDAERRRQKIVREESALVVHPIRPGRWGESIRQQRKSEFNALLYKKHPELYRQRIQSSPPWMYYLYCAAVLLFFLSMIAAEYWVAGAAAAAWLSITARFCSRRLAGTSKSLSHVTEMILTSVVIPPLSIYWRLKGAIKFRVAFL